MSRFVRSRAGWGALLDGHARDREERPYPHGPWPVSGVAPVRGQPGRAGTPSGYSASLAQQRTEARARRPKAGKLARCPQLCDQVQALLVKKYSPEQIAGVLATTYPDRPEMQVSHETIYKALYVQGRGELRRELTAVCAPGVRCVNHAPVPRRRSPWSHPGHGQHL